jgi:hypothetical protein
VRDRPFSGQVPAHVQRNRRRAAARRPGAPARLGRRWRQVSAPLRALPDFLIIGAQKCGTTSLFHYLAQHPHLVRSSRKEPAYLHRNTDGGLLRYRALFPLALPLHLRGHLCFEATPETIYFPRAPLRVRRLPDGPRRFVAILRDPVSRAVSHYAHMLSHQRIDEPFEAFLDMAPPRDEGYVFSAEDPLGWNHPRPGYDVVARGIYDMQLARWFDTFGRAAVHVVLLDDLKTDPQGTLDGICAFLHVPSFAFDTTRIRYRGFRPEIAEESLERLRRRFAEPNARLAVLLDRELPW